MPELPDIDVYVERLEALLSREVLEQVRLRSVFVLRTADPPLSDLHGRMLTKVRRLGKQIVLGFEGQLFAVIHLMTSGRLRWRSPAAAIPKENGLAAFDFGNGTVLFTETSKKKRASLRVVTGETELAALHRGGLEVLEASFEAFAARLREQNHTLKRALTDQRIFSGIGNAYSDEILHLARLSPAKRTAQISDDNLQTLFDATCETLLTWRERLLEQCGEEFPKTSQHFARRWPCMAGLVSPVRRVASKFDASSMPKMSLTTAPGARPKADYWLTVSYRDG